MSLDPAKRPVIGVCAARERARWTVWDMDAAVVAGTYLDAVARAGGIAIVIPPDPFLTAHPDAVLDLVDGLMLTGGADIDPSSYGAPSHPETVDVTPERDRVEIALVTCALERDIPFLGICRGMQLMNVALGGTLRQHLPEDVGHGEHRRSVGSFDGNDHVVSVAPGSLALAVAGETDHRVSSHHHQGVDALGRGLVVTAWSTLDDLPEAIERPDRRFALGVQWHPEADEESRVIAGLVQAARTGPPTR